VKVLAEHVGWALLSDLALIALVPAVLEFLIHEF
jgi:hypothetical protein